ncbi:hypothetical protein FCOIX_8806 [Fusarium coicis]|nr:hypothetical protein FCOIX_8806 [Fusarium coicis]
MAPPRKPHTLCKSKQPSNPGFFSGSWVDGNATAHRRRTYMFEFLRWMREETEANELKTLEKEFRGIRPIPIFPWKYIGGAPRGRYLDTWENKTKDVQRSILRRLGPMRPHSWEMNESNRSVKYLFDIGDILKSSQPAIKSELEDGSCIDRPPEAASVPGAQLATGSNSPRGSSPVSLRNMEALSHQHDETREASPRPVHRDDNNRWHTSWNVENRHFSPGPNSWAGDQYPGLSKHRDDQDDHGHLANRVTPRIRRAPCIPSSPEPVSAISLSLERFAKMSDRLHCVEDENFDVDTVAWLVMGLGADESRSRLFYFYDHATVDIWYCLGDVISHPVRHLTELGSSQEACISHGLSCKRVMVVKDELDFRRLRFEAVHRDE